MPGEDGPHPIFFLLVVCVDKYSYCCTCVVVSSRSHTHCTSIIECANEKKVEQEKKRQGTSVVVMTHHTRLVVHVVYILYI